MAAAALPSHLEASRLHERALSFYNLHTGESLKTTYWVEGHYLPESLREINEILRDFRTGTQTKMDKRLLDLLFAVHTKVGSSEPFHIISGYRSPATNETLRRHTSGVAKSSLHMKGKAIDINLPGTELAMLRKAAMGLEGGGVGYYPASNFVHVDSGRVRHW